MKFFYLTPWALVLASASHAAEIHLSDGTVVYGSILNLVDGEGLVVDTAHMDSVTIDWEAVVSVVDTEVVEVELYDGRSEVGTVSVEQGVLMINDGKALAAASEEVFGITEVKDSFDEQISAYSDIGSNFVRGNSRVSQVSLGAGVGYETSAFKTGLRASSIVNEQTDAPDTRRFTLNADYAYKLDRGWRALGFYQFESDEQQGLDGRSIFGAGFGKRLINQRRHQLSGIVGLALNVEEFDLSPRNETTEAFIGASYRLRWFVDADLGYTIFPNLEESGRVRTEFNGSLSFDLLSDLDFKITLYDRYDSDPPQDNKTNDSGLTLGLSWEY